MFVRKMIYYHTEESFENSNKGLLTVLYRIFFLIQDKVDSIQFSHCSDRYV